ncbi:hypothetical protein [Caldimonas sp. KR1-144]|uniref:hypothetical protein n=1 Tax=Caldimonas sp. KR1-144 TaxID=3400911 RepID=UPI003C10F706
MDTRKAREAARADEDLQSWLRHWFAVAAKRFEDQAKAIDGEADELRAHAEAVRRWAA